jgi:hypothetical protein
MSTLQKLEDAFAKINELQTKITQLEQENGQTKQATQNIINAINSIVEGVNGKNRELSEMGNATINRLMGLEQAHAAISKTISAVVSELSDSGNLDQNSVMTRLRKSDEAADKSRIDQMLQLGVIAESNTVNSDSLITVSQTFTPEGKEATVIAEYRSYELSSELLDEAAREKYVGKNVGDVVEIDVDGGKLSTTIIGSYSLVNKEKTSETVGA